MIVWAQTPTTSGPRQGTWPNVRQLVAREMRQRARAAYATLCFTRKEPCDCQACQNLRAEQAAAQPN